MTIEDIFSTIVAHMKTGIQMHEDMANVYEFLGLQGYAELQRERCEEEHKELQAYYKYYLSNYYKLIPTKQSELLNIIPQNWLKYTQTEVDTATRINGIKTMMKKWIQWEQTTKQLLQNSCHELQGLQEIAAEVYLQSKVQEVTKELKKAYKEFLTLELVNYDLSVVFERQQYYLKKKGR